MRNSEVVKPVAELTLYKVTYSPVGNVDPWTRWFASKKRIKELRIRMWKQSDGRFPVPKERVERFEVPNDAEAIASFLNRNTETGTRRGA